MNTSDEMGGSNDRKDGNEVLKSRVEIDNPNAPATSTAKVLTMIAEQNENQRLFEVQSITGKGKGVVARFDIARGTRIINEAPLFTTESHESTKEAERRIKDEVEALSKAQQAQYLALHNKFPEQPVSGIFWTNALPCGPDSSVAGIYPTICLINHSCNSNTNHGWNDESKSENIHAIRKIAAGEEITIKYLGGPSSHRSSELKRLFGFDCKCNLCSLAPAKVRASDTRRAELKKLDKAFDDRGLLIDPAQSLADCRSRLKLLEKEYQGAATPLLAHVYDDAFELVITQSDEARASIFARRAYGTRILCSGEDHPETKRMKSLMKDPTEHRHFGVSKRWCNPKGAVPKKLNSGEFEKWLWKEGDTSDRGQGEDADCKMS